MSNRPTDRPTATFPTGYPLPEGWRVDPRPGRYLDVDDPALAQADATPTGVFPARRPSDGRARRHPRAGGGAPRRAALLLQHEGAERPDAASLSHGGAGAHAVYHTSPRARRLSRRHPHLRAALAGIALAVAVLTGLQLYALDGINDARSQARAAHSHSHSQASPTAAPVPDRAPAAQDDARTGIQPTLSGQWVTQDSGAPYAKDDPSASPLSLPRCTTSPTTPMPCLAHVSADSSHAVVLEEDASLTGLVRQ